MKLKKIASLMLAGVMAISMLAACGDTDKKDPASSTETSTATGYSAKLADEMKDLADEDYITFEDNASDEAALKAAVAGAANINASNAHFFSKLLTLKKDNQWPWVQEVVADFNKKADVDDSWGQNKNIFSDSNANKHLNGDYKMSILFAIDGSVSMDKVMEKVADALEDNGDKFTNGLVEKISGTDTKYDCSYVVSVSVVNVENEYDLQKAFSTNFIAVTVTRTSVDA